LENIFKSIKKNENYQIREARTNQHEKYLHYIDNWNLLETAMNKLKINETPEKPIHISDFFVQSICTKEIVESCKSHIIFLIFNIDNLNM